LLQIHSTIKFKSGGRGIGEGLGFGKVVPQARKESKAVLDGAQAAAAVTKEINERFNYVTTGQFLMDAGERALERVKLRTIKGTDYLGNSLKAYTPKYQKWKSKQGRYRNKTDMWLYGDLLNAIDFFPGMSVLSGKLAVRPHIQRRAMGVAKISTRELARIHHKGEGKQPRRPFFDWRRGSMEDMKLKQEMRALMMRYVRREQRMAHGVAVGQSSRTIRTTLT